MPVDFDGYEDVRGIWQPESNDIYLTVKVVDVAAGDEDDYNPHVDRGYTEEMV